VSDQLIRIEVDGRLATADQLRHPALVNYGHFTAMQVRGGRTRGLVLHLDRLAAATCDLFDTELDSDRVRSHIRHALGEVADASVRVIVFGPDDADRPYVMVTVRPPGSASDLPRSLKSVPYQRPVPHIKHTGGFGQIYYGRLARQHGFDDALLTGADGVISEAAICNVAFYDGHTLVWPDAPFLPGITMQLLRARLPHAGLADRLAPVRLADVASFAGVLVTNSHGVGPVTRIDDTAIPVDARLTTDIIDIYESVPWDVI
jgi:prepilin-type processing-associated H-X9-DG protein